jgi:hypothetical protein
MILHKPGRLGYPLLNSGSILRIATWGLLYCYDPILGAILLMSIQQRNFRYFKLFRTKIYTYKALK